MSTEEKYSENFRRIIQDGLPSRRLAVTGLREAVMDGLGETERIYALRGIARKRYGCLVCSDLLNIGSEHVILRTPEDERGYNHHHVHNHCFRDTVLPLIGGLAVIKASRLP